MRARPVLRPLLAATAAILVASAAAAAKDKDKSKQGNLFAARPAAAGKEENCKKITGRMKLRILELRSRRAEDRTTAASRVMQQAMTPVFGGTSRGARPEAEIAADRAALEADNARLVAKGCASFDLAAALAADPKGPSPAPTVPAPGKQAPAGTAPPVPPAATAK